MKLAYGDSENKAADRNNQSIEKTEKKENRLTRFCSHLWDATKVSTQILAVAVGMTVVAYGCGDKPRNSGDADNDEIETVDVENDVDADEVEDVSEDEEVESNCLPPGAPLEGEVNPILANTVNNTVNLNSSDSEVSGNTETTVGGEVSGEMLILGECPDDPTSLAAFGAQEGSVNVVPQYRVDFGQSRFVAELPEVNDDVCPGPEVDDIPVSMFIDETNLAVKSVTVGTVATRGEFGFVSTLTPMITADDAESDSTVPLDGSAYEVKLIMVIVENPLLQVAAKIYSNTGEEILSKEVRGSSGSVDSKKLRVYQLGEGDLMLPGTVWNNPPGIICMRPRNDASEVTHEERVIDAVVTPQIVDACGRIFDGFDLESVTLEIEPGHFNPPHLASFYSFDITEITGLDSMAEGSPTITLTVTRDPSGGDFDMGERVEVIVTVRGGIVSRDINPKTGERDRAAFEMQIEFDDPDANIEYLSQCGYDPAGF